MSAASIPDSPFANDLNAGQLPLHSANSLLTSQTMAEEKPPVSEGRPENQDQITDWTLLVRRIHASDAAAMEELYAIFAKGIRYFLLRNLGPEDLDDKVH